MKTIAFYLPQFHKIPENDTWWGKGFTEWTNVKKARKYANDQYQPRVPLNDNYYDLSRVETLRAQAKLANDYSIYGFCFYHYWFNGKMLLEKPVELLRQNTDIDINYCFSWANEPWARTWDGKKSQVLMAQEYGGRDKWVEHFNYFLPYFKDDRYIKEDNKPMLIIYKTTSIKDCKSMMECWSQLAIENGFKGIHYVNTLRGGSEKQNLPFSANVEFEPARTAGVTLGYFVLNYNRIRRRLIKIAEILFKTEIMNNKVTDYTTFYQKSLSNLSGEGTYGGVFMGWDNTPRKKTAGNYYTQSSKAEFKDYFFNKIDITKRVYKTNYIFINAWNEWCEGTYLEPDVRNKYKYLEAIDEVLNNK